MKELKFKIVVPYYNSEWIIKCLESIQTQTFKNFDVIAIDDCSKIDNFEETLNYFQNDSRFKIIKNEHRKYALYNIYHGLKNIFENDEDVAMIIDGDDWLSDENSLQKVANIYESTDCVLTHGSWISYPDNFTDKNICCAYPENIIKKRDYRYYTWRATQLRTFKYFLFNKIKYSDLLDNTTNDFYKTTYDLALMFPMLEMAGQRIQFIEDKIYTYNTDNPINDFKVNRKEQLEAENMIRSKKKYKELTSF
jgi:glycosyltransferase involved in cell wall biosynthesis